MTIVQRVYVGNVVEDHVDTLVELKPRFDRFGRCLSETFESHGHFAYITMEFTDESAFLKLKNSLNGVRFKRNVLRIDLAKPSWREQRESEQEDENRINAEKQKQLLKQQWEYHKKIENIQMNWIDRQQTIQGRMRESVRPKSQLRNATFRILQDGRLKVYKCFKNKLWGYERNKQPRDLVARFTDRRHWRDGNDHIVDKLDYSRASSWSKHQRPEELLRSRDSGSTDREDQEVPLDKTRDVLDDILGGFDFDKPMVLQENEDEDISDSSDYEFSALYRDAAREKVLQPTDQQKDIPKTEETPAEPESQAKEEFTFNFEGKKGMNNELVPTFGIEPSNPETNNTENLRSLFNPEDAETANFKLMREPNEDIDVNKAVHEPEAPARSVFEDIAVESQNIESQNTTKGLFFPHFASPFLHSQSQLAKLKTSNELDKLFADWDNEFWENRATWTKEMKRRKRDAVRQYRKKNSKSNGNGLLV
ncbi:LAME_0C09274g1_1 [Lachancea meyersii CBS 8951]|uniref:LAME_0C09274g1_1 n=1 Tax=Lachancea meyersii CBS 8951 TaxID=1266667 RepID=A0A1G4J459_9SACH|nr:LAME_0C09274g1_1 [Lachancea meyersii CBS 8951]